MAGWIVDPDNRIVIHLDSPGPVVIEGISRGFRYGDNRHVRKILGAQAVSRASVAAAAQECDVTVAEIEGVPRWIGCPTERLQALALEILLSTQIPANGIW